MVTSTLTSKMPVISLMGLMLLVQAFHCFSESDPIYEPQPFPRLRLGYCLRRCHREREGDYSYDKIEKCVRKCLFGHRKTPPAPAPAPTFPPPSSYPPPPPPPSSYPPPPSPQPTYLYDDQELDDADAQELENYLSELLQQDGLLDADEGILD